jgi:phytoene synthase
VVTLEESYAACRGLARRYGTSFYWATAVLPAVKRPHVHALYAFCRRADDIVDEVAAAPVEVRAAALATFGGHFRAAVAEGRSDDVVLKAVVHTVRAFDLPLSGFERFLRAMAMDLSVTSYARFADLRDYMDGSAAVIGELLLPILEPVDPVAALEPARALGEAFQVTNFLRDVGEDLDRGRTYLPQEDLAAFGVALERRVVDDGFRALMRFEVERCRALYRDAEAGLALLPDRSRRCVAAAHDLYGRILDRIEAAGYDVFDGRARVATPVKLAVAARHVLGPSRGITPPATLSRPPAEVGAG